MDFLGSFLNSIQHRNEAGDLSDRFNYQYTAKLLCVFALGLMGKLFAGTPIQCWTPAQFTGTWEGYTETFCYIKSTYFLPMTQSIDAAYPDRDGRELPYYQWVPIMLGLQALFFYLPSRIWRLLSSQSVMEAFTAAVISVTSHRNDAGDFADRWSYSVTSFALCFLSLTLFAGNLGGKPIQCWMPAQFHASWEAYAESYCYVKNTYFLAWRSAVPPVYPGRREAEIAYYQWVPILLMLQAAMFLAPRHIWTLANSASARMFLGFLDPFIGSLNQRRFDCGDIADRLQYQYTAVLIAIAAAFVGSKVYIAEPLQCFVPAQFTKTWEAYAENLCFVRNSLWYRSRSLDVDSLEQERLARYSSETLASDDFVRVEGRLTWYQWVPLALAAQALLCALPQMIWQAAHSRASVNVKSVLNSAAEVRSKLEGSRAGRVEIAATHIQEALDTQRELGPRGRLLGPLISSSHYGTYVTGLYLFVKVLYIGNVVGQFFLLNTFLGMRSGWWGFNVLSDLIAGREWEETAYFPRVTMCDFQVRVLGNLQRHTVQCVLMINMFNEKIYVFLWWWFLFLSVASIVSFIYWTVETLMGGNRRAFVEKYLRVHGALEQMSANGQERAVEDFVSKTLRPDGVTLLRMIQGNGGDLLTGEIVMALFRNWAGRKKEENARMAALHRADDSDPLLAGKSPADLRHRHNYH